MKTTGIIFKMAALFMTISAGPLEASDGSGRGAAPVPILVTPDGQYQYLSKLYYSGDDRPREPRSVVVLNFMGLKCAHCRKELPLFMEVMRSAIKSEKFKKTGMSIRFFVVSTDPLSSKQELMEYLEEQNVDVKTEVLLDPYKKASNQFGVNGIPRTFVISPEGFIVSDITGVVEDYKKVLLKGIADAIKGGPPSK